MNKLLIVIFFSVFSFNNCKSQKLSIPDLINSIYFKDVKIERLDTVLFIGQCDSDFFIMTSKVRKGIVVLKFPNKDSLNHYIRYKNEYNILKLNIEAIGTKVLNLKIGLYRNSSPQSIDSLNFLTFVDERTVLCGLINGKWQFTKTIKYGDY